MKETDAVESKFKKGEIVFCPAFGYGLVKLEMTTHIEVEFDNGNYTFDKFDGRPVGLLKYRVEQMDVELIEAFRVVAQDEAPKKFVVLTNLEYAGMIATCSLGGFLLGVLW